ncbi:MAG: FtsQ-type POTRA domain-containing protein [Hydrotalea sp.]|nr:FtsQ-type POTRA domain-containing protein [Hydrotalea sp.]
MDSFLDIYNRIARLVIIITLLGMMGFLYFFFYPPLNPASRLYFITPRIEAVAIKMGFVLRATAVSETTFTPSSDIIDKVLTAHQVAIAEPLPLIPARAIKLALEQLPMIESATVVIHYPSRELRINFVERVPVALLAATRQIITRDGRLLPQPTVGDLPDNIMLLDYRPADDMMVQHFIALYNQLQSYSLLLDLVHQAQYVGGRRWRLWLTRPLGNGYLQVDMPEDITPAVMERLSKLVLGDKILNLKIEKLDLRLENQTIVRLLSPDK